MTEKEKIRLWAKGRLFEVMNGIGDQDAKSVLIDLLSFIGSDLESDLTHSVTKISDQEIPISDDIEKEADICWDYVFSALGWDENSLMTMNHKEFLAFASHFAEWQKQQMEAYRIKHCNNITNEQAELESDFVSKHVEKNNRMPTFLDAIEYGMELQKQQMMKDAVHAIVDSPFRMDFPNIYPEYRELKDYCDKNGIKDDDKVKLIIIKEIIA